MISPRSAAGGRRGAPLRRRGGRPTEDLLHGGRPGHLFGPQQLELVRPLDEREHGAGDRVPCRFGSGREQQREERGQFVVAEARRVHVRQLGVDDVREHVGAGPQALLLHDRRAVRGHAVDGLLSPGAHGEEVGFVGDVEDVLDGLEEEVAVGLGHPEQHADGLHGELGRDVDEEVAVVAHGREQPPHSPAQLVFERADGGRAQALGDQTADPGMTRIVHHVEHHAGDREVLDDRAPIGTVAARLRRKGHGVVQDAPHLVVGRHRPEALAVRRVGRGLVPPDRRLLAVTAEDLVREPGGERVEVGQVDPPEVIGHRVILVGVLRPVKNGAPGV